LVSFISETIELTSLRSAFKSPEHRLYKYVIIFGRILFAFADTALFSSILLEMKDLDRYTGAYILPNATAWDYGTASQPLPRELDQLASRNELNTCLSKFFSNLPFQLLLPLLNFGFRRHCVLTLSSSSFNDFTTSDIPRIGYPGVLEDILGDKVVFSGSMPWVGPLPIALPADDTRNKPMATKLKLHLNAYRAELEASLVTASSFLPFAVSASSCGGLPPPDRICKFLANVGKIDENLFALYFSMRNKDLTVLSPISTCVALVFGPTEDSLRAVQYLYDWVWGGVEQGKRAADLILVQAVEYNSNNGQATWWMDRN
jgi:hypothetical protein